MKKWQIEKKRLFNEKILIVILFLSFCFFIYFSMALNVNLVSPSNLTYSNNLNQNISCNAAGVNLTGVGFYVWNSTNYLINQTNKTILGTSNQSSLNITFPSDGTYRWNCFVNDSSSLTNTSSPRTMADNASVGTIAWDSPDNAKVNDGLYAGLGKIMDIARTSHYLKATNFSFNIPAGATINGILVEMEKLGGMNSYQSHDSSVKIVKGGVITGTDKADTVSSWPSPEAYVSHGGSTDLWGTTWTASDINNENFGVVISAYLSSLEVDAIYLDIDHIRITVYYLSNFTSWSSQGNYTLTIDTTKPNVSITSPENNSDSFVNSLDINFNVDNLFNVNYQTIAYYPLPGRSYSIKILFQITK